MTTTEINKAIAEACGWTDFVYDAVMPEWICGHPPGRKLLEDIPNFSTSLDAMAEARGALNECEQVRYTHELLCLAVWTGKYHESNPPNEQAIRWGLADATPQQHAEAFLRAKGLWE